MSASTMIALASVAGSPGWACPSHPGFFLYYPSRHRQPAVLRAFVDFVRRDAAEALG